MKDKKGIIIREGDRILSKDKWEYVIFSNPHFNNELYARGKNLKHTDKLEKFNSNEVIILDPRRLPDNIIKDLGLKESDNKPGMCFPMDLILYERGDVIISNYDFTIGQPELYDPDLSKKHMWLVFCKKQSYAKWFKASDEFITYEIGGFKAMIADLENEILSKFN